LLTLTKLIYNVAVVYCYGGCMKLYTVTEAAELLGVSPATVRAWSNQGKLKTIRTLGGHRRISAEEIDRALKKYKELGNYDKEQLC